MPINIGFELVAPKTASVQKTAVYRCHDCDNRYSELGDLENHQRETGHKQKTGTYPADWGKRKTAANQSWDEFRKNHPFDDSDVTSAANYSTTPCAFCGKLAGEHKKKTAANQSKNVNVMELDRRTEPMRPQRGEVRRPSTDQRKVRRQMQVKTAAGQWVPGFCFDCKSHGKDVVVDGDVLSAAREKDPGHEPVGLCRDCNSKYEERPSDWDPSDSFEARRKTARHDPIAYTYDGDVHCPGCAIKRWGQEEGRPWVRGDATDSEGNTIGVVAPWDETSPEGEYCGTCGGQIAPPHEEYLDDLHEDALVENHTRPHPGQGRFFSNRKTAFPWSHHEPTHETGGFNPAFTHEGDHAHHNRVVKCTVPGCHWSYSMNGLNDDEARHKWEEHARDVGREQVAASRVAAIREHDDSIWSEAPIDRTSGNVKPKCRSCGTRVEYFGDYCKDCDPGEDHEDGLMDLTNQVNRHRQSSRKTAEGFEGRDTVYKERSGGRDEYWTYSEGHRVFLSEDWVRKNSRSIKLVTVSSKTADAWPRYESGNEYPKKDPTRFDDDPDYDPDAPKKKSAEDWQFHGHVASTSPGYYLVGPNGAPAAGPFTTMSEAEAHVGSSRAAAIEYKSGIEDPEWDFLRAKPFPYGLNTVVGARTDHGEFKNECESCGGQLRGNDTEGWRHVNNSGPMHPARPKGENL